MGLEDMAVGDNPDGLSFALEDLTRARVCTKCPWCGAFGNDANRGAQFIDQGFVIWAGNMGEVAGRRGGALLGQEALGFPEVVLGRGVVGVELNGFSIFGNGGL